VSLFFIDSSALVKRYVTERGTPWLQALVDPRAGNTVLSATITRVEVAAALASRHRAPAGLTRAERDGAVALLEHHCLTEYILVPIDTTVLDRALLLTQQHRLRGYDAVQLATALVVHASYRLTTLPSPRFLSADRDRLAAAHAEGLGVDDPNDHP
jgi:predicted nucleic acid-binding protein